MSCQVVVVDGWDIKCTALTQEYGFASKAKNNFVVYLLGKDCGF